jgi:hypothetical protein
MAWRYNPRTLSFDKIMPPPPPPASKQEEYDRGDARDERDAKAAKEAERQAAADARQDERLEEKRQARRNDRDDDILGEDELNDRNGGNGGDADWDDVFGPPQQPTEPNEPADSPWDDLFNDGGDRNDRDDDRDGDEDDEDDRDGGQTPADQVVPGSSLIAGIPAPDGFAYSINPLTGDVELIDTTPLDPSMPLSGWKWLPDDVNNPKQGHWSFFPTPDILEDPFNGIPSPVRGWLQVALDAGGDVSQVPEGPAREWVNFLLTQATNPTRRPNDVPFGTGLPNFPRADMPTPPGGTPPGGTPGGDTLQSRLTALRTLIDNDAPRPEVIAAVRAVMEKAATDPKFNKRKFFDLLEDAGYQPSDFQGTSNPPPPPQQNSALFELLTSFGLTPEQIEQALAAQD